MKSNFDTRVHKARIRRLGLAAFAGSAAALLAIGSESYATDSTSPESSSELDSALASVMNSTQDLDDDAAQWMAAVAGDAYFELTNVGAPSSDGKALKASVLRSGESASVTFYRDLFVRNPASIYSLHAFHSVVPAASSSVPRNKELTFTIRRTQASRTYLMSLMWMQEEGEASSESSAPLGMWYYYDAARSTRWSPLFVYSQAPTGSPQEIQLDAEISGDNFILRRFEVGDSLTKPNVIVASSSTPGDPDSLQISVTLPGNSDKQDTSLILDDVDLTLRR